MGRPQQREGAWRSPALSGLGEHFDGSSSSRSCSCSVRPRFLALGARKASGGGARRATIGAVNTPLRAAFFDMGGTLLEGLEGQDLWYAVVMQRIEREFGPRVWADALYRWLGTNYRNDPRKRTPGDPYRQETNRWIGEWLRARGEAFADAEVERLRRCFAAPLPTGYSLAPGAADALRWCKDRGLIVGVVTNTITRGDAEIQQDWRRLGLDGVVDFVVSSHSTGWTKPHPAMFERAFSLAGASATEAVMWAMSSATMSWARNAWACARSGRRPRPRGDRNTSSSPTP